MRMLRALMKIEGKLILNKKGVILTDIDGAVHPPTEGRRASTVRRMRRRIGKSSQRRMRPRTALFDRSSIVIGERHRIRFRTRCRLIQLKKNNSFEFISTSVIRVLLVYFETGVGSVAPLAELHGGASGLGVGGVVARTALSFSAGEHFHT